MKNADISQKLLEVHLRIRKDIIQEQATRRAASRQGEESIHEPAKRLPSKVR